MGSTSTVVSRGRWFGEGKLKTRIAGLPKGLGMRWGNPVNHREGNNLNNGPWTMLFVLFRLRALESPWNSEIFPLAVAGGSKRPNGSESVPRKSSESFRGTTSVDDERALKSPWNGEIFPLAVTGRSMSSHGRESVPRKSSETFRGTTSVNDERALTSP